MIYIKLVNIMFLICLFLLFCPALNTADLPCAARSVSGESVLCVCNSTYCDTISKHVPDSDKYHAYTSSEAGLRFRKSIGNLNKFNWFSTCCSITLELDVTTQYQTIEGFGGAVTDSASMIWKNLSEPLQKHLIDSYFSDTGLECNMVRVPIGGTDFSTRPYAYNELPENDVKLTNFSLATEDYQFKLPFIKQAMKASKTPIHIIATTWSPPPWMKTNHAFGGLGHLKPEYYQTYADYHYKFVEEYTKEGVPIWGITTTNEPFTGKIVGTGFNALAWTPTDMGKWIEENLGPTMRNSRFKDVKIIVADDQRLLLLVYFNQMVMENPETLQYIDGIAVHYYTDFVAPAIMLTLANKDYPDIFIIATEACEGNSILDVKEVILGSWYRATRYIRNIMEDLNYNLIGWIDWNMCLNEQGGPSWYGNYMDSVIIVNVERDEFYKQPMFYALGHFAKFIPRGSKRVRVAEHKLIFEKSVENVAFLTPRNTVVVVLYNDDGEKTIRLKLGNRQAVIQMERRSITTVEFRNEVN